MQNDLNQHNKLPNKIIGLTGEYFVCAELSARGWIAVLTPRNTPEIDIMATTFDGLKFANIQIKTKLNKQGWKFNKNLENKYSSKNFFIILVNLVAVGQIPEFYIFKKDEFADLVKENYKNYISKPKKDGGQRKNVEFRWFDYKDFKIELEKRKNKWDELNLW